MLIFILFSIPVITIILTWITSINSAATLRILNFMSSIIILVYSLFFILGLQIKNSVLQTRTTSFWSHHYYSVALTPESSLMIDGISMLFMILTVVIFPLCFLSVWNIKNNIKELLISLHLLEILTLIVFMVQDIFLFYIFFEIILIPMFYIIINWGPNDRKIKAAFYFFIYTFIGSILLLFAIFFVYNEVGSTHFNLILTHSFSTKKQMCLTFLLFFSFAVKIPMLPFHLWLPEAHVEAPTVGSVILAALLLKLGSYGMIRLVIPIGLHAIPYLKPCIFMICILSVIYASFMAVRQIDLKRLIAYSSIAHMNLSLLGLFTVNIYGISGAIILMIAHGVTSAALFFSIGVIYDRYHTRLIKYYSGLVTTMPLFVTFFFFFNAANFSLPGTFNFIGEFLILFGLSEDNSIIVLIVTAFTSLLGLAYSLILLNKLSFGYIKINFIQTFKDINRTEFIYFIILFSIIVSIGFFPSYIFDTIETAVLSMKIEYPENTYLYSTLPTFYSFLFKTYASKNLGHIYFLNFWIAEVNIRIPIETWGHWYTSTVFERLYILEGPFEIIDELEHVMINRYINAENITRWVYSECVLFLFNTPPSGIRIILETASPYIDFSSYDSSVFKKWIECKIYNRTISRLVMPTSVDSYTIQLNLLEQSAKVLENVVTSNICDDIRNAMFEQHFEPLTRIAKWYHRYIGPHAEFIKPDLICTPAGCYVPDS